MGLLSTIGAASGRAFGFTRSAIAAATDEFFNRVTLLLPGNGTNGTQNNTFLDSGTANGGVGFSITRNPSTGPNAPTQGTFSPFSQTGWGLRTNDRSYLTIPASSDFDLISTDFTVEFWFNLNTFNTMSGSGNNLLGNGLSTAVNGWFMGFDGSGTTATSVTFGVWSGGSFSSNVFSSLTLNMGTWYHIALQRNGTGAGNLRLFVNGVLQGSAVNSVTYLTAASTFVLGSGGYLQNATYSGNADYYISNVRLTKAAVYSTSGFTSPTSNLSQISGTTLLICQSNRLINNGTNTGAITSTGHSSTIAQVVPFSPFAPTAAYSAATVGGSGYFDGTGDYLTVPSTSALAMGTGDFCVEMWIYPTAPSGEQCLYANFASGGVNTQMGIFIRSGNSIRFSSWDTTFLDSAGGTIVANAWHHLVVCRSGNNGALFINGARQATSSGSPNNFSSTDSFSIGRRPANDQFFPGYICGLRSVKGSSVYDPTLTTLTLPTAPPTAITNTSLLLNFTNAGITDATAKNDLETVGNAQISTTQSKFGGSSMYFDGTGDYALTISSVANSALGSGDWTVEFWLYTNVGSTTYNVIDWRPNATQGAYFSFYLNSGTPTYYTSSADRIVGGSAIPATTWTHVAVSRSGTSTKMFINGTQSGSTYTDTANYLGTVNRPAIGGGGSDTNNTLNGYIDDLRVTRGYARYTANFTAPTSAFALQ